MQTKSNTLLHSGSAVTAATVVSNILSTAKARAIEVWLNVTAIDGTPTLDVIVETSVDGVVFGVTHTFAQITTAAGVVKVVLNDIDDTLGTFVRVTHTFGSATSITYSSNLIISE